MKLLDTLNDKQRQAAMITDSHVRIIAGAGSGKTRVLMARIAYLVQDLGVFPNRIMAITFTNKATKEMKDRLYKQLNEQAYAVRISTIHSLCVRILREDAYSLGYPTSFTIMDGDDQKQILRPYYKEYDIDKKQLSMNKVLSYISGYKTQGISPEQAKDMAFSNEQELICKLYKSYENERLQMKAMDFDDLLIETRRLLIQDESVRTKWQNRVDYIHVDEFQDVDLIQYDIVKNLTGKHAFLCVVGDPDQTIYTWRGASVDIILQFNNDFKPCQSILLEQNYRSTKPILDASNALIKYNKKRIDKNLYTEQPGNDLIEMHVCQEEGDEPLYISRQIVDRHRNGTPYGDMAILYRSNFSSRSFERVLRTVGIPYRIFGGIRFYERQEIKDALAYLKLCSYPDEKDPERFSLDLALLRVINQPRRGIGQKTIEKLQEEAKLRHKNLYETMKSSGLSPTIQRKLDDFIETIEDFRLKRESLSLEDFLDYILEQSGYKKMLHENNEEERIDNLEELKSDLAQSLKEDPTMTLESYLQEISLFTDTTTENAEDSVSLMTVHAAKGLEFDTVFLVNFNEGIFPSGRSINEGGSSAIEEERRLAYVAMTRAKRRLYITWNQGYSYLLNTYKTKSRFVLEIPKQYVHLEDPNQKIVKAVTSTPMISKKNKKIPFKAKDRIQHKVFGQGIVLKIQGDVATIAFGHPHGIKTLNALHPSIQKIEQKGQ